MKTNLVFLKQKVNEIHVSIDKISIFASDKSKSLHKSLFKLAGITPKPQNPDTTRRHCFGNKLLIQGKELLLKRTKESKELYLNLLQPTTYIQIILLSLFLKHLVTPILSCFELTFDFYMKNREEAVTRGSSFLFKPLLASFLLLSRCLHGDLTKVSVPDGRYLDRSYVFWMVLMQTVP